MAKNSYKQIKIDENKILTELQKNSNKSINEISRQFGFSRQKVWRIIKNLEKNKTIWGYTAIVDEEKINKKGFIILIKRTNKPVDTTLTNKIANRELNNRAEKLNIKLVSSFYTHGSFDWLICFMADNIKDAKRFVEDVNRVYQGYITDIQLLEKMFVVQRSNIENPDTDKIKDFLPP